VSPRPTPPTYHRIAAATLGVAVSLAVTTGLSACSSTPPAISGGAPAGSASSPAMARHLTAAEFSTALKKTGTIVLDVRTPGEFASGHLPAARNIDIGGADFATRIAKLDKNATYAVYCHSGQRSAAALQQMAAANLTHAYDLAGGMMAWENMGGPMMKGQPDPGRTPMGQG
jgi:phage shock protein E